MFQSRLGFLGGCDTSTNKSSLIQPTGRIFVTLHLPLRHFAEALEPRDLLVQPVQAPEAAWKPDPDPDTLRTERLLVDEQPQVQALEDHDCKLGEMYFIISALNQSSTASFLICLPSQGCDEKLPFEIFFSSGNGASADLN